MAAFPRISIVTPSFNQAAYLEQTLRSVIEQGYPDLEYIVIDGASSDGSVEIIRRYERHLKYWVSEPDHGQAEAVNKGLAQVSGEIIGWLNSDDYYLPGALQAAAQAFQEHPDCGLIYGDVLAVDGAGVVINELRYNQWTLEDLMSFNIIGQPAVFLRRSVLEQAGWLDVRFHFLLDHQLWLRMAQLAPILYVPERWAAARFHAEAKNVAQAASFGQEVYAIVAWMQTQPALAARYQRLRRRIWAGAHRINAYYLAEGRQPAAALAAYGRSFLASPALALRDWRRILLTLLSLFGVRWLWPVFLRMRQNRYANLR
jgi:GT2 family glycosyltransferase